MKKVYFFKKQRLNSYGTYIHTYVFRYVWMYESTKEQSQLYSTNNASNGDKEKKLAVTISIHPQPASQPAQPFESFIHTFSVQKI